jgi:gliding motility-associated-like protein
MAYWFSIKDGALSVSTNLNFQAVKSDTIFALIPGEECATAIVYAIGLTGTKVTKTTSEKYVCQGSVVTLTSEPGWEQILWSSTKNEFLSNESSLDFQVTQSDTVKLRLSDGTGCIIQRNTALNISKPELELEDDAYQIIRGGSVQLSAQGGETYLWSPATGLDSNTIGNPVASPVQTTEYTVTVSDSIGCVAMGKVLVIVEETAFIPNLFTPNEDGRNDEIKVYGLHGANNFSFRIFNREGSLMYTTENISELSNSGWNGTVNGVRQPSGVYYWKVLGENNVGKNILLNGKSTGSIVLIR